MFRFTIRDVLWLMVVVAMGVCWYQDHKKAVQLDQALAYEVYLAKRCDSLEAENRHMRNSVEVVRQQIDRN